MALDRGHHGFLDATVGSRGYTTGELSRILTGLTELRCGYVRDSACSYSCHFPPLAPLTTDLAGDACCNLFIKKDCKMGSSTYGPQIIVGGKISCHIRCCSESGVPRWLLVELLIAALVEILTWKLESPLEEATSACSNKNPYHQLMLQWTETRTLHIVIVR